MRGKKAPQKKIKPEVKYNSQKLAKFINYVMRKGKKSIATKIVYQALDLIQEKKQQDPLKIFQTAMENISPVVEVRSRRIGGANYQIPFPTNEDRRFVLASRWLIQAARSRKGHQMADKLAQEILEAAEKQGNAIKKKEDVHRMAQANKAFAHFARY
jgi:small subunit ribosomal protein S7